MNEIEENKLNKIQLGRQQTQQLKAVVTDIGDALKADAEVVDATGQVIAENKNSVEKEAQELKATLQDVLAGNKGRRCMFCYILLSFLVIGLLTRITPSK